MSKKAQVKGTIKQVLNFPSYLRRCYFNRDLPESVYFFTFHKCASTLFSHYVLNHIQGLAHIDYEELTWKGLRYGRKFAFHDRGFVYGPIRLILNPQSISYQLCMTVTQPDFIKDKKSIFFIRDPRDILVSSYYSFGFSHTSSPIKEVRDRQKKVKQKIQQKTLDDYVLESVSVQVDKFKFLEKLLGLCEHSILIKYEDMVGNFDLFSSQLCEYIEISESTLQDIYNRSRPKREEKISSHRRSGQVGGFRSKLKAETIASLNLALKDVLAVFEYEA